MKTLKKIALKYFWLLFLLPTHSFATHVAGSTLTYTYLGGSSYAITFKLFKDCAPGSVGFSANETIFVSDIFGQILHPQLTITIPLVSVTNVTANLDPCAIPPNPLPCIQEGIYTTVVNNLPPNPGGYCLFYLTCCRNAAVINVNNPLNSGETVWAIIPGMQMTDIWLENFSLPNGTTIDNGPTSWSITPTGTPVTFANVNTNSFFVTGANNSTFIWTSQLINTAFCAPTSSLNLRVDLGEFSTLEPGDSISVFYSVDGGPLTLFTTNGKIADDFTSATASVFGIVGSNVRIVIRIKYDAASVGEIYSFDNVRVSCVRPFIPNSDPSFNTLPPLYLCVNKPFTFDHSATDLDGDSLVYSLYHPADVNFVVVTGVTMVAITPPTFSTSATSSPFFPPPISYKPGYSSTNPFGTGTISINPSTGSLFINPGTIGQFVVGVRVREFRNGVFIGETVRDFQYRVVNCPVPPPSLNVPNKIVYDGCVATLTATGISTVQTTWTSVFPGAPGAYNNFLNCTASCITNTVSTPVGVTAPPFIDFVICGIATNCGAALVCDTFRVNFVPTLSVNIFPSNPAVCFGAGTTSITATGAGGFPPYQYLWNNVNPSQGIVVAGGTTWNVQLSDASNCPPVFRTITVGTFTDVTTVNAGPDLIKCKQSPSSIINGTITGSTGGSWSGGSGTYSPNNTTLTNLTYSPTAAELAAGSVTLILTSAPNFGCPLKRDSLVIKYFNFSGIPSATISNVSCFAGNNGSVTVNVTGGFKPYQYLWNTAPSQTTTTISNLTAQGYIVSITDSIGCINQTTVNVTQPTPININSIISPVFCIGSSTGSINISPVGGVPPYTYSWSPGGQTTPSLTALSVGTYTAVVTDFNGCTRIIQPIITNFSPLPLSVTFTTTNVTCFGSNNGLINTTAAGGTAPYTYSWNPGGSTTPNISALSPGTRTLIVRDSRNCTVTNTILITQPSFSLSAVTSNTAETCDYLNDGKASVTVSGGTGPYTYTWQPSALTTSLITNRASGIYTVIVSDANGCLRLNTTTITQPANLAVTFQSITNVSCFGGNTGIITANSPSGGTGPYTYSWNPGGSTGNTINNLSSGTYSVIVTDSKGCVANNAATVTQPTLALNFTTSSTSPSCFSFTNGVVSVSSITGGTPAYSYTWMPGNNNNQVYNNVKSDTYTITAKDALGCTLTNTVFVSQPTQIVAVITTSNSTCGNFNGTGEVISISGGTAPFTYAWSVGTSTSNIVSVFSSGSYSSIVTDASGCSVTTPFIINDIGGPQFSLISSNNIDCFGASTGSISVRVTLGVPPLSYTWSPIGGNGVSATSNITLTATSLPIGSYNIVVEDASGCKATSSPTILTQPDQLIESISISNVSCFGSASGSASVSVSGGTPAFTYTWLPSATTGSVISGLTAGNYSIQISDANNCSINSLFSINQPTIPLQATSSVTNVTCFGLNNGIGEINVTGGTGPFQYNWLPLASSGQLIGSLSPGNYTVNVIDFNNCSTSTTLSIIQPLAAITATEMHTNVLCFGLSNGSASVTVSGGTPGYSYNWSLPAVSSTSVANNLDPTDYFVTVSDLNNCQTVVQITIDSPTEIIASLVPIDAACGLANGSITSQVTGGTAPYTYSWSPIAGNNSNLTGLLPNTYTLDVGDFNNCIKTLTTTLVDISGPTLSIANVVNDSCFNANKGLISITITSGSAPYSTSWLPYGGNGTTASSLAAGIYTASVIDANGCLSAITATITEPAPMASVINSITNVSCFNGNDGSISVLASGGTPSYTYSWTPSNSGSVISNLTNGLYSVVVKDSKYCTSFLSASISQPSTALTSSITSINQPKCATSIGDATAIAAGGTPPYFYSWSTSPPQTTSSVFNLTGGTYSLTVTDNNGCVSTNTLSIIQPNVFNTLAGSGATVCVSQSATLSPSSSATITAIAVGGVAPYSYNWQTIPPATNTGTLVVTPQVNTTYIVVAIDANGCAGNADTIKVVAYSLFAPNDISALGTSPICPGQVALLEVQPVGNTGPLIYNWSHGLGTGNGPKVVTPVIQTTYSVTSTNSCGFSRTDAITIFMNPAPTVLANINGNLYCVPDEASFTDNSTLGNPNDPITKWSWNFGDGSTSDLPNPTHIYKAPGTYTVTLTVTTDGGCVSSNSSSAIIVNAYPYPKAAFTVNSTNLNLPYDPLICTNQSTGAVIYRWDFGDGNTSNLVNPRYNYTSIGYYEVQLIATNQYGCSDTADYVLNIKTEAEIVFPNAFTPNGNGPSGGYYVSGSLDNDIFFPYTSGIVEYKLQIFNRWGELIFETTDVKQGWDGYYKNEPAQVGVYIWKANAKFNDGKTFNKTGDVTLLK
ncbi:MAG: PKD domain-containing protein [Bacteroidota bacterium]